MNRRAFISNFGALLALMALGEFPLHLKDNICEAAKIPYPSNFRDLPLRVIAQKRLHHGNGRFINPFSTTEYGSFWRLVKWKLFSKNNYKHLYRNEKEIPVQIDMRELTTSSTISATFVKHSTVYINYLGKRILVDPVFSGLFPFIRDFSPLAFDPSHMPQPHIILVTHGHYDHLDTTSLRILDPNATIVSPLGYEDIFKDIGFNHIVSLDWYQCISLDGLKIMLLPCNHWTMRNPFMGPNRALWGSFLIGADGQGPFIFVSGDTGYFRGFKEIGKEFKIDFAIFNLGPYEPRWFMAQSHMNPPEAAQAFVDLNAQKLMVVHWGTFRLGDEPVYLPPLELAREMEDRGLEDGLINIRHGQTYRIA